MIRNIVPPRKWIIVLRHLSLAACFGLIFAIIFERLHTPIGVYFAIGIPLLVIAAYGDRWFVVVYKRKTNPLKYSIEKADFSELRRSGILKTYVQMLDTSHRKIKSADMVLSYRSRIFNGLPPQELGRINLKFDNGLSSDAQIEIPLIIHNESFINEAIGASRQGLEISLLLKLEAVINPVLFKITIPENVTYCETLSYTQIPNYVL